MAAPCAELHSAVSAAGFFYRVRAQGSAPVTNPFILVNASGTDFRRGDDELELESVRITANWRF